jgi:DNA-binding SARP family transcriptional activator
MTLAETIELRALGTLRVVQSSQTVDTLLAKPRPTALFLYLAAADPGAFQSRDKLVTLFWAESNQDSARTNLRGVLKDIRDALGATVFESRGDEDVRLSPGLVRTDVEQFLGAIREHRPYAALELYRSEFADGFSVKGAPAFQDWLDATRRDLRRKAIKVAMELAEAKATSQERTEVLDLAHLIMRLNPELEDEHQVRKLMDVLDRIGDRTTALRLYEKLRQRLQREFGAVPSPETRALYERVKSR